MSQYMERMALGDTIDVKGPLGHFIYEGRGYYRSHGTPGFATRMSMIAGGTGITPLFQVIKARAALAVGLTVNSKTLKTLWSSS